jgi:GNAT superfamily N-acetyltransferase/DNA-binding MarR family transcriptional regulator
MDYLDQLGCLAIGSRLKRLSERFNQEVAIIYKQQGIDFEPRWFPVFHYLSLGEAAIMDIAKAIEVTHPAVNQTASELLSARLIEQVTDPNDKRRRLLSLSKKGKKLFNDTQPSWRALKVSINESIEDSGQNLLTAISELERALDGKSLPERFAQNLDSLNERKVTIVDFQSAYRDQFRLLNEAWITSYFELEAADREILNAPEKIIEAGGAVLFAQLGEKIVGTCALLKSHADVFELAKMAVDENYQGMGIGQKLLEAAIARARGLGAIKLTLETNAKLKSAVALYRKAGFQTATSSGSKYARVDLVMELSLEESK